MNGEKKLDQRNEVVISLSEQRVHIVSTTESLETVMIYAEHVASRIAVSPEDAKYLGVKK